MFAFNSPFLPAKSFFFVLYILVWDYGTISKQRTQFFKSFQVLVLVSYLFLANSGNKLNENLKCLGGWLEIRVGIWGICRVTVHFDKAWYSIWTRACEFLLINDVKCTCMNSVAQHNGTKHTGTLEPTITKYTTNNSDVESYVYLFFITKCVQHSAGSS